MKENIWEKLDDLIEEQLQLQIELSLERHLAFMLKHGLLDCKKIVDIGTGNGLFLAGIAEKYPGIEFHGIDNKSHMIEKARATKLMNCKWILGDALDAKTHKTLSSTNGILMRYFVLHMPNTHKAFSKICGTIDKGTKLWVFDLDLDHCICEPEQDEFIMIRNIVETFCNKNQVEIRIGSKLPPILNDVGFTVKEVEFEPFNNQEIDHDKFAEYVFREAVLYNYFLGNDPDSQDMKKIKKFLFHNMHKDRHFVQYGMVMISAVKE